MVLRRSELSLNIAIYSRRVAPLPTNMSRHLVDYLADRINADSKKQKCAILMSQQLDRSARLFNNNALTTSLFDCLVHFPFLLLPAFYVRARTRARARARTRTLCAHVQTRPPP